MNNRGFEKHPGPMRFMRIDSEVAGIIIAIGFVIMGVVAIPLAKWFLLGALLLGGAIALLLRFSARSSWEPRLLFLGPVAYSPAQFSLG